MSESHKSFTELTVWQKARSLKNELRALTTTFPKEEQYRLTDQIIRSSRSVAANIAEGHGRYTYKDQLHFCIQARGSLNETMNHLIDAMDCNYINEEQFEYFKNAISETERILNGYIAFLRKNL